MKKKFIELSLKPMFLHCSIVSQNTILSLVTKQFPFIHSTMTAIDTNSITVCFNFGELNGNDVMFDCVFEIEQRKKGYLVININ